MSNRSIITASIIQIIILGALILALFIQSNQTALQYSRMAELSANRYAAELDFKNRNDTLKTISSEREEMRIYVDRTVESKLAQFRNNQH